MRQHRAVLACAVTFGASCFSCSNTPETSNGGVPGEGGSVAFVDGGGPSDASRGRDAASVGEGSPSGNATLTEAGLVDGAPRTGSSEGDANAEDGSPASDAGAGDAGLSRDSAADSGSFEAGSPCSVPGTVSIFDGKDLNGWEQSGKLWSVVDGVIDGKGTTGGQLLVTDVNHGDFRVIVSSNLVAAGGTGHLGICFWGEPTPLGQYNDCKLIIPPNGDTWDYSLGHGLDGVTKIKGPAINPTWNTTEILCWFSKGFCRVAINGTDVLTYQEPNLGSIHMGPIGLQIHDGTNEEVQYKNVCLDPAPTVDMLLTVQ
jgi:Domain of Unknown Function (DUF1080)